MRITDTAVVALIIAAGFAQVPSSASSTAPEVVALRPIISQVGSARNATDAIIAQADKNLDNKQLKVSKITYALVAARFKTVQEYTVDVLNGNRYMDIATATAKFEEAKKALSKWQNVTLEAMGVPQSAIADVATLQRERRRQIRENVNLSMMLAPITLKSKRVQVGLEGYPRDINVFSVPSRVAENTLGELSGGHTAPGSPRESGMPSSMAKMPSRSRVGEPKVIADFRWLGRLFDPAGWQSGELASTLLHASDEARKRSTAQRDAEVAEISAQLAFHKWEDVVCGGACPTTAPAATPAKSPGRARSNR